MFVLNLIACSNEDKYNENQNLMKGVICMKKIIALILVLFCVLALYGCTKSGGEKEMSTIDNTESSTIIETKPNAEFEIVEPNISIADFSYAEESALYSEGEPGVKTSGFVNTAETEISFDNVVERALNECTVKYYTTQAYFDSSVNMWKVVFNDENILGGDQTVYMDGRGITTLIVYGE